MFQPDDVNLVESFLKRGHPDRDAWIIDGVLPRGGFGVIFGATGHFKTRVTLDLALSVAAGRPWAGRFDTTRAPVRYFYLEGDPEAPVVAWKKHHGLLQAPLGLYIDSWLELPRQGNSETLERWAYHFQSTNTPKPGLIVVDPWAKCIPGSDENAFMDVSQNIRALRALRVEVNPEAAVLVVQHSGVDTGRERGHTAMRSAAEVVMKVTRTGDTVQVSCAKAPRNAPPFDPVKLNASRVRLIEPAEEPAIPARLNAERTEAGSQPLSQLPRHFVESIVMTAEDAPPTAKGNVAETGEDAALRALMNLGQATATDWLKAANVPERTFYRVIKRLEDQGRVTSNGGRYRVAPGPPPPE